MTRFSIAMLLVVAPLASGFAAQPRALQIPGAMAVQPALLARHSTPLRMNEEPAEAAPVPAEPAPEPTAPPPVPEEREFDITNYSLTLTLLAVFVLVKVLSATGLADFN